MNEKVKSILKNKNYKGSKKGYYLFILILTALYGATILYTYIHEGKIWISGGPVEKDIVYIFSTVIYIFSLLLSLSALKSVLPNIKKIFTEEFGLQDCGDDTYYNESAQYPFYFSYETIKLDEPLMKRAIGIKKYRNLLYSNKSVTMQIYGKLVFTNMTLSMIKMNLKRVREEYSYLTIKAVEIDNKVIVKMKSNKDYYDTVSAKYVLALLISMYEVGESFGRENEHDYEETSIDL